jgi:CNT family concentrative nucleoside transporter
MQHFTGLVGLAVLLAAAFALSSDRGAIRWRIVVGGVLMQAVLALLVLRVPLAADFFQAIAAAATRVLSFADAGAAYLLGDALYTQKALGFIFAFHVLPSIIFFASFMSVLYHAGIMQQVVRAMAYLMNRVMGVSGAESLAMAANVFVGQTEAPLVVRPYVEQMTRSELMTLMVGGFATIAGGVFAAYVAMLGGEDAVARVTFAKHLITASVMSAPAAFVMAKIMLPETERSQTAGVVAARFERTTVNVLDAATRGATDGLRLAANVGAMLLALIALIAGIDYVLGWIGSWGWLQPALASAGIETLNLKSILGLIFAPLAWTMGVPGEDVRVFGSLLGEKLVFTEFIAYGSLAEVMQSATPMAYRSELIATYALCGFANFGSIAIQLGGIGTIAPLRRGDLARLGLRAMIGGAMASFMTATIAGMLL